MGTLPPEHAKPSLTGEVVVFTGKLSSLGRKEAQALVVQLGGSTAEDVNARTTILVVGAEGAPSVARPGEEMDGADKSAKVKKAEELNRRQASEQGAAGHQASVRIMTEAEFCRVAGIKPPEELKQQYYAQRDLLAMYPGLREDHLRYLQKWGLVRPALRTHRETYYAFADLLVIRQVSAELPAAGFRAIVRSLQAARQGQLAFDFRLDAEPARIIKLSRPKASLPQEDRPAPPAAVPSPTLAEEYFLEGSTLDADASLHQAAAEWYRKALEVDPYLVPALINLANIYYGRDELAEAQALYERAIGLDQEFFEAHFNLGNIYHDLSRFQEAAACYRAALSLNADYAEAHFYLAIALEKSGQSSEAKRHWRAYQRLAPNGEWVELAREFSE